MYLSDPIVSLEYESGNIYIASLEFSSRKIRVFWEDEEEEDEFECFTVFDATDESGEWYNVNTLIEKTDTLVQAHKLESENSLLKTSEYPTTKYPPES